MDIEIRLLRAFITLAELGNYRLSAEKLFLTQPALTKQIQTLEKIIDSKLFIRSRNGAKLTKIGLQLYPEAQKLFEQHQHFLMSAQKIKKITAENLRIGFGISSFQRVPQLVHAFSNENPKCQVIAKQIPSSVQINMLLQGELDIGFVRAPVHDSLHSMTLFNEHIVLAAPDDVDINPSNMSNVLTNYSLLHIKSTLAPCLAEQTKSLLSRMNIHSIQGPDTSDLPSLLALIAGKNGVAFVPAGVCHFLPKGVKLITPKLEQIGWDIAVAWNPNIQNNKRDLFLQIVNRC